MKILFHHRIRSKDGQYVHMAELTQALRDLGHEVILVGPAAVEKEGLGAGAGMVERLKRWLPHFLYELLEFGYSFFAYARLWMAVRQHNPDCIYERYNLFLPVAVWLKHSSNLPMLLEVNAPVLDERRKYSGLSLVRLARWTERYTWRGADRVLPVTQVLAERVRQADVPAAKIVVIPNGVNRRRFEPMMNRNDAKRRLGLEGRVVLGFIGFMREWHRLELLLGLIADARDGLPLHLLLVGEGPARRDLEEYSRIRGIESRMTITGVIGREEIAHYLAAFDIALQPAVVEYASPLKLFEYMAAGCAIVAPAAENIKEVLTHQQDAFLFDPDDTAAFPQAVETVCGDLSLRDRLARGAKQTIEERGFTWANNAKRIVDLFAHLGAPRA